jgi:hypothetical protein
MIRAATVYSSPIIDLRSRIPTIASGKVFLGCTNSSTTYECIIFPEVYISHSFILIS